MIDKKVIIILTAAITLLVTGCISRVISAPGITGRFIEGSTGKPISGTKVKYTNVGSNLSKESITDANGRFHFEPEFSYDYTGFPVLPISLKVELQLVIKDQHNFSYLSHFVKNTDIKHATIDAGDILVNKFFLNGNKNSKN